MYINYVASGAACELVYLPNNHECSYPGDGAIPYLPLATTREVSSLPTEERSCIAYTYHLY
jgi:hypothetical protein